jgi:DNA-binding NarL/FixJ family response regulator
MKKYKIVIVENDEDERTFMKKGFNETPYFEILAQVHNGDHLFKWLNENGNNLPDIILSDLNMPGKNGMDIISEIKEQKNIAHIPVVITSTSSTPSIIQKCLAEGAAGYIVKPEVFIDYAPFANNLHELIEEKGLAK